MTDLSKGTDRPREGEKRSVIEMLRLCCFMIELNLCIDQPFLRWFVKLFNHFKHLAERKQQSRLFANLLQFFRFARIIIIVTEILIRFFPLRFNLPDFIIRSVTSLSAAYATSKDLTCPASSQNSWSISIFSLLIFLCEKTCQRTGRGC